MQLRYMPDDPALIQSLQAAVAAFEAAFPGQIAAYYLGGSRVDGSAVETSDVDVDIVFRDALDDVQRTRAQGLDVPGCALAVDPTIWDRATLAAGVPPYLKRRSILIYGEHVCRSLPISAVASWARDRMHAACWLLAHVYRRPLPLALPVDYPDTADEYFGYLNRTVVLPSGKIVPTTRNLVRTAGWIATAQLAHQTGISVDRKRDVPSLYRQQIGGDWTDYLYELHERCINQWRYRIPSASTARERLRALCRRTLAFEQAFLLAYRAFVLAELRGADNEAGAEARRRLCETPLDDPEVQALVGSAQPGGR
jgi:hypothetical protein